ncbi:MAG: hypothetical protein ACXVZX_15190 [Terriglobales bacterium]
MPEIRTCNHMKDDGSPCNAIPVHNTPYCYFHRKYYNPPALPGDKNYQAPLLESHHSIQLALTHLYQAFLSKKIDMKEANFGLQILRLASKTISAVEKTNKEKCDGRRSPSTGEPFRQTQQPKPSPNPQSVSAGFQARTAERSSATTCTEDFLRNPVVQARMALNDRLAAEPVAAQPKRGVWDPYGCMPKPTEIKK